MSQQSNRLGGTWRAVLVPGAIFLLATGPVAWQLRGSSSNPPAVSDCSILLMGPTEWDVGEVDAGTVLQTGLIIKNSGDRRLVINEITCQQCGSDPLPTVVVGPGQSRKVTLKWDTAGVNGPLGMRREFASNDPQRPTFHAEVKAHVSGLNDIQRPIEHLSVSQ